MRSLHLFTPYMINQHIAFITINDFFSELLNYNEHSKRDDHPRPSCVVTLESVGSFVSTRPREPEPLQLAVPNLGQP